MTRYTSPPVEHTSPCSPPPACLRARPARAALRRLGSTSVTVQRPRAGVVLTFPVARPAGARPACNVAIEIVVDPAETTRVWGHEAVELDENTTTGRFASNRLSWDRQELEWFEAGEHLHEQPVEDQTERDPRGLPAPARRRLLLVLCASAVAAFALALACIDLVAR